MSIAVYRTATSKFAIELFQFDPSGKLYRMDSHRPKYPNVLVRKCLWPYHVTMAALAVVLLSLG